MTGYIINEEQMYQITSPIEDSYIHVGNIAESRLRMIGSALQTKYGSTLGEDILSKFRFGPKLTDGSEEMEPQDVQANDVVYGVYADCNLMKSHTHLALKNGSGITLSDAQRSTLDLQNSDKSIADLVVGNHCLKTEEICPHGYSIDNQLSSNNVTYLERRSIPKIYAQVA